MAGHPEVDRPPRPEPDPGGVSPSGGKFSEQDRGFSQSANTVPARSYISLVPTGTEGYEDLIRDASLTVSEACHLSVTGATGQRASSPADQ
jgi:hypothetical protein